MEYPFGQFTSAVFVLSPPSFLCLPALSPAGQNEKLRNLDVKGKFSGYQGVLHRESGEVLEHAAQRGYGCSVLGGVPDQVGRGHGQPGLVPDLEVGDPWGPFQPKPFYDSMIL